MGITEDEVKSVGPKPSFDGKDRGPIPRWFLVVAAIVVGLAVAGYFLGWGV